MQNLIYTHDNTTLSDLINVGADIRGDRAQCEVHFKL